MCVTESILCAQVSPLPPAELCLEYAKLLVRNFRTVLELEWWRHQQREKRDSLNEVRERWAASKERALISRPVDDQAMKELTGCKRAWHAEDMKKDLFPTPGRPSESQT